MNTGTLHNTDKLFPRLLIIAFTYVLLLMLVALPVVATLTEVHIDAQGHAHDDHAADSHSKEQPSSHTHNQDTQCPCLCCPGHFVALEPTPDNRLRVVETLLFTRSHQRVPFSLPSGVQRNLFRPPQHPIVL